MSTHPLNPILKNLYVFPADQHTYIKTLAAAEGLSLRQFVIEHLPSPEKKSTKHKKIPKRKFNKLLKKFLVEKAPMLKRLSDK
ncbi:MAG TPA: hypothetical protein VLE96_00705 [Chlamydiales bacterium]|nr:hypothetical protein [Chlamydiales bacterium]